MQSAVYTAEFVDSACGYVLFVSCWCVGGGGGGCSWIRLNKTYVEMLSAGVRVRVRCLLLLFGCAGYNESVKHGFWYDHRTKACSQYRAD